MPPPNPTPFSGGPGTISNAGSTNFGWSNPTGLNNVNPLNANRGSSAFAKVWIKHDAGGFGSGKNWTQIKHFNSLRLIRSYNGIGSVTLSVPIGSDVNSLAVQAILDGPAPLYIHVTTQESSDGFAATDLTGIFMPGAYNTNDSPFGFSVSLVLGECTKIRQSNKSLKNDVQTVYELQANDGAMVIKNANTDLIPTAGGTFGPLDSSGNPMTVGHVCSSLAFNSSQRNVKFYDGTYNDCAKYHETYFRPAGLLDQLMQACCLGSDFNSFLYAAGTLGAFDTNPDNKFAFFDFIVPVYRYDDWQVQLNIFDAIEDVAGTTASGSTPNVIAVETLRDVIQNLRPEESRSTYVVWGRENANGGNLDTHVNAVGFAGTYPNNKDGSLYAPWCVADNPPQGARAAELVGVTQLGMNAFGLKGLGSYEIVLGRPQLPKFPGLRYLQLGEIVKLTKAGNELFTGRVTSVGYTQEDESVSIVVGMPDLSSQDDMNAGSMAATLSNVTPS